MKETIPPVETALRIAITTHADQQDKGGSPYILHVLRVMLAMEDDKGRVVALLHDVIEDGDVTLDHLKKEGFSDDILHAVDLLTRKESDTYEQFIEKLRAHSIAQQVKIADIRDNMNLRRIPQPSKEDLERVEKYRKTLHTLESMGDHPRELNDSERPPSSRLQQALELMYRVHGAMVRKGDDQPYIVHPIAVYVLLADWSACEDVCIAGLLHDVLEDAPISEKQGYREEIRQKFGSTVLDIVEGVTEQDKSLPWKERKKIYLAHLKDASPESLLVSCADRTHNVASLVVSYAKESEKVWKRFNAPKEWQVWFIDQVVAILKEKLEAAYTSELCSNVKELNALLSRPLAPEDRNTAFEIVDETGRRTIILDPLYLELRDHCMLTEEELGTGVLEEDAVRRQSRAGDAVEHYVTGLQYFDGNDVKKDVGRAVALFSIAADKGLPSAQFALGALYFSEYAREWAGKVIETFLPLDNQMALTLFCRSAANGHAQSQMMLAEWYEEGIIVRQDRNLAKVWMEIARNSGQFSPLRNGDMLPHRPTICEINRYQAATRDPTLAPEPMELVMYEERDEKGFSRLSVKIEEDGDLRMSGFDVGERPREFWGDDDYEYDIFVKEKDKDELLLKLLKKDFKESSDFMEWLKKHDMPYIFDSWV